MQTLISHKKFAKYFIQCEVGTTQLQTGCRNMPENLLKSTSEWIINFLHNSLYSVNLINYSTNSCWIPELPQSFKVQTTTIYILEIKVYYVFRLLMLCPNLLECYIYLYWQLKRQVPTAIKENQTKPNQTQPMLLWPEISASKAIPWFLWLALTSFFNSRKTTARFKPLWSFTSSH